MLIAMLMGFSAGVPILLTSRTLQLWLSFEGASNVLVGYAATFALPYTFKFLWAPVFDRFSLPFLSRRRGWLIICQAGLLITIAVLSRVNPVADLMTTVVLACLISFFAASQDTLVDAFRRESLKDEELGMGASVYQLGYRIAMWLTGGLAVIMAGQLSWNAAYLFAASLMIIGMISTLWADEPNLPAKIPSTFKEAVVGPLKDFFGRDGAVLFLVFVLLYKVGDNLAGNMLSKFYRDMLFSPEEIGLIAKSMGPVSVVLGALTGGALIIRLGIYRSLFIFGILQALSTLSFIVLAQAGHHIPTFAGVIFFEDFTAGMGSSAFLAFMAILTNRAFTATQFALLTSLMTVPRTILSSQTGHMVDFFGWQGFFLFCAVAAVPGLMLLSFLSRRYKLG